MNTTGGSERKVVKITEERMNEVLPPNILESELDLATKKVLAALCDWYLNSPAKESGIVIISNKELVAIACVGGTQLQKALRQLQDYNLVDRIIGTGLGNASQYRIDFIQMMKPLKRKSFAELFNLELEEPESSEKPISTIVQYSIVQSSSDKSSSSYNSSEKSIEDKSIAEEGIPEGTGFDGDLFETKTYLKNGIIKNDFLKENSNTELVRAMEEGLTEPMTKNEEEGKEDPNEYQDNKISSGENQEPSVEELHEDGSQATSPSTLQSNDGELTQQEESSTEEPQLTPREEFKKWKRLVDPELNKLKHITTRKLFGEEVKQFYKFYDQTVYDEGFSHDETQEHLESYIDGVINGWEGFQT